MTDTATIATAVVDRYVAIWNEHDAARRRALIGETFTETATFVDPLMQSDSQDGFDALMAGVQAQFPDFRVRIAGTVDSHHDVLRFFWEYGPEGVDAVVAGVDYAVLAADGRLASVAGFIDLMPPMGA
jgi:hypothetical protein